MSKDNYRPISLASVVSKVVEIVIYNRISVYLDTCPNQFGFKSTTVLINVYNIYIKNTISVDNLFKYILCT